MYPASSSALHMPFLPLAHVVWCSSTGGTVIHPHTPQPRPTLFCGGLMQTRTATECRSSYGRIKRMKWDIMRPAPVFSHLHTRNQLKNAWTLLMAAGLKEPNIRWSDVRVLHLSAFMWYLATANMHCRDHWLCFLMLCIQCSKFKVRCRFEVFLYRETWRRQ